MWPTPSRAGVFVERRAKLVSALSGRPAILAAGCPRVRNSPALTYPFRADSHFLYFTGRSIPGAALLFDANGVTLFVQPPAPNEALWRGAPASMGDLAEQMHAAVLPIDQITARIEPTITEVATLPPNDDPTAAWISCLLGRDIAPRSGSAIDDGTPDARLADAIIALRLQHDEAAIAQMRQAAAVTALAHAAGLRATVPGRREAAVCAAMLAEIGASGMTTSYEPIVTVHGEVLHREEHDGLLRAGDLLLADVGAESPEGWAADVTRVWPVGGRFSGPQRAIYEVVLAAEADAIAMARPGVRYRAVHQTAARTLVEGLVGLGILRGSVDGLLERGAHALFFPHGIGHLIGLDVHDMEDLGDRAAYPEGRSRSPVFAERNLRLDRDLAPGMAVTIEPGFYQVPAVLDDPSIAGAFAADLDRARLAAFADVRGIRIEDDVVITETGPEVITAAIPKTIDDIESLMAR
jgi:Xaa-Pro aminopeptidase